MMKAITTRTMQVYMRNRSKHFMMFILRRNVQCDCGLADMTRLLDELCSGVAILDQTNNQTKQQDANTKAEQQQRENKVILQI